MELRPGQFQHMAEPRRIAAPAAAPRLRIGEIVPLAPAVQRRHGLLVDGLQLAPANVQLALHFLEVDVGAPLGRLGNGVGVQVDYLHLLFGGGAGRLKPLHDPPPTRLVFLLHGLVLGMVPAGALVPHGGILASAAALSAR